MSSQLACPSLTAFFIHSPSNNSPLHRVFRSCLIPLTARSFGSEVGQPLYRVRGESSMSEQISRRRNSCMTRRVNARPSRRDGGSRRTRERRRSSLTAVYAFPEMGHRFLRIDESTQHHNSTIHVIPFFSFISIHFSVFSTRWALFSSFPIYCRCTRTYGTYAKRVSMIRNTNKAVHLPQHPLLPHFQP
jgi:hypothetical protein